ncbi:MAG: phosphotransferase [Dehalococcoidia bacterium]|jgi:predicted metal-dependent phosphoesterase TrpH|nr:phosphotransferase [Dehalococcoidia bacterium]
MSEATTARPGRADLQIHTAHGDGMGDAAAIFAQIESMGTLNVVAVTDHDDIEGALLAREVHARGSYSFDFVPGIEVTTRQGHLLGLWVDEPLRSFRSLEETVAAIHEQGGLAVLPHPFSMLTRSIGRRRLERTLAIDDASVHPDGIELANPTMFGWDTHRARRLNEKRYGLAITGGSDAHFTELVGSAYTTFAGRTSEELRLAILERTTDGVLERKVPLREIGVRRLLHQQVRGLSVTPRKVLGPPLRRAVRRVRG